MSSSQRNASTIPDVATRVHSVYSGRKLKVKPQISTLWTRKSTERTPLADHISRVKEELYGSFNSTLTPNLAFTPSLGLSRLQLELEEQNEPFVAHSRELVEMTSNAVGLLREIIEKRSGPNAGVTGTGNVWAQPIIVVQHDPVGIMLQKAHAGANEYRSTKSKVVRCTSSEYGQVMEEFGLAGVAAYPVFSMGSWWIGQLLHDFDDSRQDYICILDYNFYVEYNADKVTANGLLLPIFMEVAALWDMPGLSDELQVRRSHMLCSMTFFDLKRINEGTLRNQMTDGLTAWIFKERDSWRDFKALDSGGFAHYLSFAAGVAGRDDMMLAGLVNDWVDLGPDLRYQECNQSVFALTRGSLAMNDLVHCYERTVWMLNASFASEERHVGCMSIVGACVWQLCNHRHDVWRYYSLAYDLCSVLQPLDLYKIGNLADCYFPNLELSTPPEAKLISVPRERHLYHVNIDQTEYKGSIMLHTTICNALKSGLLPKSVVDYQIILPLLLRNGEIDSSTFLSYMDSHYCAHFANVMRSGYFHGFSHSYGRAIAALVMEEWWSGLYFAIGFGSLIEAQPDYIANDRSY